MARYEKSSVDNGGAPMFFDSGAIHWAVYGHGLLYEVVETINGSGKLVESEVLYYHTDQVGSTVAVTNQARQDVLRQSFFIPAVASRKHFPIHGEVATILGAWSGADC